MKLSRLVIGLLALAAIVLCAGCAPEGHNLKPFAELTGERPAGFWLGLWHGIIFPITFIVSLFNDKVGVYEIINSGKLYNFGFILGLFASIGGTAKKSMHSKNRP